MCNYNENHHCISCRNPVLTPVISFGKTPVADRLVTDFELSDPFFKESMVPLDLCVCSCCSLVQLTKLISPESIFNERYPYFSSAIPALVAHSKTNALDLMDRLELTAKSLVIEIASNDGYMLQFFQEKGIPVLGIDPARKQAEIAASLGVPTLIDFFGRTVAHELRDQGKTADLVIANNVLAHVPDLNGFVAAVKTVLKPGGTAVMEVPYLRNLIENCEFDTIYHQHVSYFSLLSLDRLFLRHSLYLNDVLKLPIHGGSLRLYVSDVNHKGPRVLEMLDREKSEGIDTSHYYREFSKKVALVKQALKSLLADLKNSGKTIAAYGAAAKGNTLLSVCGIDSRFIDFIADINPHKHGKRMGGNHIRITSPDSLEKKRPDYTLLLAWNFADEIIAQQEQYLKNGGKFIIPIPKPVII